MKTTVDLPFELLERSKIAAAKRRTTFKSLVVEGLETVLQQDPVDNRPAVSSALRRLKKGYHLGGTAALPREETHGR